MYQYQLWDRNDQIIIAIGFCVVFVQCPVVLCCCSSSSCVLLVLLTLREELESLETRSTVVFFSLVVSHLRSSLFPEGLESSQPGRSPFLHHRQRIQFHADDRTTPPHQPLWQLPQAHHRYEGHTGNQRLLLKKI